MCIVRERTVILLLDTSASPQRTLEESAAAEQAKHAKPCYDEVEVSACCWIELHFLHCFAYGKYFMSGEFFCGGGGCTGEDWWRKRIERLPNKRQAVRLRQRRQQMVRERPRRASTQRHDQLSRHCISISTWCGLALYSIRIIATSCFRQRTHSIFEIVM